MSPWLIDTSAIARLHLAADAAEWASRIERGLVWICTVTRLEIGYAARSATDHRTLLAHPPIGSMPVAYLTPKIEERAIELQAVLAARGQHRAPSVPDLLIAATAELTAGTCIATPAPPSEGDANRWTAVPLDDGERALGEIADWGPAEDWSDWAVDAAR